MPDRRTLIIETATATCSVAYFVDDQLAGQFDEIIGRGHAERLLPMIAELPDGGRAERIVVGLGPGSFTGIRVGLAAARALGFAWQAEVIGYSTMNLLASQAFAQLEAKGLIVAQIGGHGQYFVQAFDRAPFAPGGDLVSVPIDAIQLAEEDWIIGSAADAIVRHHRVGRALPMMPSAAAAIHLAKDLLRSDLSPIYGRGADAIPMTGYASLSA